MPSLSQLISGKSRARGSASNAAHPPSWFESRRELLPTVGTARELYRNREQVELVDSVFRSLLDDPATLEAIERDLVEIPATTDREGYFNDRHLAYWLSGLEDFRMVQRLAPQASYAHVLDFGGATGRFARHIVLADQSAKVTIADLNVNHVEWVEQHFGQAVRSVKVSPYPYFPLADGSVTFCVGLSVFTHIDSYESGWLAEMHRVLVDGGYAVVTIHSEQTWPIMPMQAALFKRLQRLPEFQRDYRLGQPMPAGRHAYTSNPNSIEHNCNVFMDSDYVRQRWSRWFEVVDVAHRAHHDFQAAVILRKTGNSR
jgi:ubiquinone/menaquinone biosynthesis C-methylase UbiE